MNWEYKTLLLSIAGFATPKVDPAAINASLNDLGRDGWELVSAFDTNAGAGASYQLIAIFKRALSR